MKSPGSKFFSFFNGQWLFTRSSTMPIWLRLYYPKHSRQAAAKLYKPGPVYCGELPCQPAAHMLACGWHPALTPVFPLFSVWAATQLEWMPPSVNLCSVAHSNQPPRQPSKWLWPWKQEQKAGSTTHHILSYKEAHFGQNNDNAMEICHRHQSCLFDFGFCLSWRSVSFKSNQILFNCFGPKHGANNKQHNRCLGERR